MAWDYSVTVLDSKKIKKERVQACEKYGLELPENLSDYIQDGRLMKAMLQEAFEEAERSFTVAFSADGKVKVTLNGRKEIVDIEFSESLQGNDLVNDIIKAERDAAKQIDQKREYAFHHICREASLLGLI